MSESVLATADLCPHLCSSSICEWCNYKVQVHHLMKRAAHLEKALRLVQAQAGLPDPADACRQIIKTAKDALGER